MRDTFDRFSHWLVRRPALTLSLNLLITLIALLGYINPSWWKPWVAAAEQPAPAQQAARQPTARRDVPNVDPVDLTHAHAVLVVAGDQFFFGPWC